MPSGETKYRAIISSDWNQCLAPCGPFDCITFVYPALKDRVSSIFKLYTGNDISLSAAVDSVRRLLPCRITQNEMDAYLDTAFRPYNGVLDLMEWCDANDVLFMINTTGMLGYFQRVFAKELLPSIPILSANPMIRFQACRSDPQFVLDLHETEDKPKNTEAAMHRFNIPHDKVILLGDSGGDGPHFKWGAKMGAFLIGSMTKGSLDSFCKQNEVNIDLRFGVTYEPGAEEDVELEMQYSFMELTSRIEELLKDDSTKIGP